jgi:Cu+-exporting ATPase
MPAIKQPNITEKSTKAVSLCYHCGTACITDAIAIDDKVFCCEGCKLVYELLNENGLCDYYKLQNHPGLSQVKAIRSDKYACLDNDDIASKLYTFTDGDHTIVTLYIPGVHCSSCMWLLEHLNKMNAGVSDSRLNFTSREVTIRFSRKTVSLRQIAELLATIGYEPYISLDDAGKQKAGKGNKQRIYKLGIAGFCFGNIMMMSFPEYLAGKMGLEQQYVSLFRYLNLFLSLPVVFYCASEFFITAWKGIQQKMLNIDAPIALAIIITFTRSVFEILTNSGSGYLDSMSGIVFFMLVGRVVQERTWKSISFHRDYKSYFPIAVSVETCNGTVSKALQDLVENDIVILHNDEIIPADGVVLEGTGNIDYSFVTGESAPVMVKYKELVYAGGRQMGGNLKIQVVKPVAASYLTSLWNHHVFSKNKETDNDEASATHVLSKYFTWILMGLALCTAIYWSVADPGKIITSVTAMLIVACPCALLLTVTFTNGNLLRIFSNNGLFLRDATVIEQLAKIDHIVFDKTGTLTQGSDHYFSTTGHQLSEPEKDLLYAVVRSSRHPYSRALCNWLGARERVAMSAWKETPGRGINGISDGSRIMVGSAEFTGVPVAVRNDKATVYVRINDKISSFHFHSIFRESAPGMIQALRQRYRLSLLSGDNDKQQAVMKEVMGNSELLFGQKPLDKLRYIGALQEKGNAVMMIGDGLNDAGALQQSNVGITLADDVNNFTPSCDAILDASRFALLPAVLRLARASRYIIAASFVVSVLYNFVGLFFAIQGKLTPMVASILMPCSTISIVLITSGLTSILAARLHLSLKTGK